MKEKMTSKEIKENKLKRETEIENVGQITLGTSVDITVPCYGKDVWCRKTITNAVPGKYLCQVEFKISREGYKWVSKVRIVLDDSSKLAKETQERVLANRSWINIGYIGVDAGLAGFFADKPDFSDAEWISLCDWMYPIMEDGTTDCSRRVFLKTLGNGTYGFWTNAGYGDGSYDVYAIRDQYNNKPSVVALEIRFL